MKKNLFAIAVFFFPGWVIAQPAVRNEPRHHNIFENEYVRLLDVWLAPGDTTQFHIHASPSVFNMFTKTVTGSQLNMQQPLKGSMSVAGKVWYDSLVTPRIHRVWNEDTSWFHVMDIELIAGTPNITAPRLLGTAIEFLFDEPLARGYRLHLAAGGNIQLPASKGPYLLVSLGEGPVTFTSGGAIQHRVLKAGHYTWVDEGRELSITAGSKLITFTLLQLK